MNYGLLQDGIILLGCGYPWTAHPEWVEYFSKFPILNTVIQRMALQMLRITLKIMEVFELSEILRNVIQACPVLQTF